MRTISHVLVVACSLAATIQLAAQQARDAAVQVRSGTGVISGVIVAEDDKKPLRGTVVTLNHVDRTYGDTAITDQNGRFVFSNIPAGRFVIGADRDGFIPMKAGATRPGRAGIPIALAQGEQRTDIRLALPRGAVLAGTVRMPDGEPAAGATIMLQRVITSEGGRRYVDFHGDISTDDRGMYRAFGLVEGDYLVQALPELHYMHSGAAALMPTSSVDVQWARAQLAAAGGGGSRAQAPPERPLMSMAATYFPNVVQRAAAPLVTVGRGEVRTGVDITLHMRRTYRVSGTVTLPAGELQSAPDVYLVEASAEGFEGVYGTSGANFTFVGVAPGTYTLVATAANQKIYGMSHVTVGDQDVRVSVTMQPGLTVSGKLTFAGGAKPLDPSRLRMWLAPPSEGVRLEPRPADIKPDGSFSFDGVVPGPYRLMVNSGSGSGWSLRSAMYDGRDMSLVPVEIGASGSEMIAVTLSDRSTELTGRLTDALGLAASDYFIVVFSTNERAWFERSRVITQTRPASDGQFNVRELPPGEYFLAALTDLDRSELFSPAFLRELVPAAIRLTLAEGERKVQNIQIK